MKKHIDIYESSHATLEQLGKDYGEDVFADIVDAILEDKFNPQYRVGHQIAEKNEEIERLKRGE
jgi:hypothetical protein